MGVAGVPFSVSGGEDGVDQQKCADDLSSKAGRFRKSGTNGVGAASDPFELSLLEASDDGGAAHRPQTLHYYVKHCPRQRQFPRQQQPERHRRVYVTTCPLKSPKTSNNKLL